MEWSECAVESLGRRLIEHMHFDPYLVVTIHSKRLPCLNFAVYIESIRNYNYTRCAPILHSTVPYLAGKARAPVNPLPTSDAYNMRHELP